MLIRLFVIRLFFNEDQARWTIETRLYYIEETWSLILVTHLRFSDKNESNLKSELNLSYSTRTIGRTLKNTPHLKLNRIVSKPILTKKHKSARLQFCRQNMQQNWNLAWYSDEKRFNLNGQDRDKYYFHDLRKIP